MPDIKLSEAATSPPGSSQLFGKATLGRLVSGALRRLNAWTGRKDVVVLTDCATWDDRAALAYLALSHRWQLRGVVSTFVPAKAEHEPTATSDALSPIYLETDPVIACLQALPLKHQPPVVAGADGPLTQTVDEPSPGAELIIDLARAHPSRNRLMVVVLGAATDLACALTKYQGLQDRIEVVAAAFDRWPEGNDESKVRHDVAAWQVILDSSVPVTFASSLAAQKRLLLSPRKALERLRAKPLDNNGRQVLQWLLQNPNDDDDGNAPTLRSLLAVACVLGHAETIQYARPTLQDDTSFLHGGDTSPLPCQTCIGEPRVHWITRVDEKRFWGELVALMTGYTARRRARSNLPDE